MSHRWTVVDWLKRTYGNLCHIGGQWVSGQSAPTFHYFFRVKRVNQLAMQELNLISQFNFNLVLPDIITNKTLEESALPGTVFSYYPSHLLRPLALVNVFVFQFCWWFVFRSSHYTGKVIYSPDLALSFRYVLWRMGVSKWYSC